MNSLDCIIHVIVETLELLRFLLMGGLVSLSEGFEEWGGAIMWDLLKMSCGCQAKN